MELSHFALITGPFVGRSSMLATAEALRAAGAMVTEPDPHQAHPVDLPSLGDWALSLVPAVPRTPAPVVVGYGAGTVLAAWLAPRIGASALILVDGEVPPDRGAAPILPDRVSSLLRGAAGTQGLPRWSDWWTDLSTQEDMGLAALSRQRPELVEPLAREQRHFPADWLDQTLDLDPWTDLPVGYLRLSRFFTTAAEAASGRGWPVETIDGSHLHPALMGAETAGAILAVAGELDL
ncbi:hypothetical protein OB2597_13703 [Pseudooceanicola batsensis HTCC2597]|uniref:AB hydrolase-1 domain-containing protein n=1 Tax=Pseudooceanicola batsensis (strain ATCC BAA-863 / DSM 15984 / KCTC 12145 / HTCC2597) TaxID=252305 RepID=A3TYG9_PSEBH|nr:hypothetical protein [Pseudooceanicola batsensis]EAQ03203.1 hypothetical protein OB2597_13703 [Pseudooceanicola batsensis HTCC2597]